MSESTTTEEFVKDATPPPQRGQLSRGNGVRYGARVPAYYNKSYALALLPVLHTMITSKQDKEFLRGKVSTDTMYQRVHQSFAYCLDHLDKDGSLEKLRSETMLRRTPKGIVICFKENAARYDRQVHTQSVLVKANAFNVRDAISTNWRQCVHDFIENPDALELKLTDGFALTPQEQAEIKSLVGLVPPDDTQIIVVNLTGYVIHLKRAEQ